MKSFRKFFGFSLWIGLGSVADSLRDATTTFFIGRMLGNSRLGNFAVGSQFGERLELVLYTPMERTLFAAFSSIQDDAARVRAAYLRSIHLGSAVILPVCAGMGLIAPEIIAVALGPGWSPAAMVLAFVAPITAVYLIAGLANSLTNALGHPRALFKFKMISALMNAPAIAIGITYAGLAGALWACAFTAGAWYLFSIHVAAKVTGMTRIAQVSAISRSTVSALVMTLAVVAFRSGVIGAPATSLGGNVFDAASLACVGLLAYAASHIALWQVSGRPQGIETVLLAVVPRLLQRP